HLGGFGDLAMAAYQKYFEQETVEDYDLVEMIRSASEKITTRKVLLVAHSQGNFYANSFYDTVVGPTSPSGFGGASVPAESIGVYAVATPASRVAGGGKWMTSGTDKVIAGVVAHTPNRVIMPPNTNIKIAPGDDQTGHGFSTTYLKYRGAEIVSGIQSSLDKLKVSGLPAVAGAEAGPCIAPPALTITHRLQGVVLATADPVANVGSKIVVGTVGATYTVTSTLVRTADTLARAVASNIAAVLNSFNNTVANLPKDTLVASANPTATAKLIATAKTAEPASVKVVATPKLETEIQTNPAPAIASVVITSNLAVQLPSTTSSDILDVQPLESSKTDFEHYGDELAYNPAFASVPLVYDATPISESHEIPSVIGGVSASNNLITEPVIIYDLTATSTLLSTGTSSEDYLSTDTASTTATSTPPVTLAPPKPDGEVGSTPLVTPPPSAPSPTPLDPATLATTRPVVINEIAWGGTSSNPEDEWIELYNRSSEDVNLSGFTLYSKTDQSPYINLSGIIPAHDYFLIEAKNTGETDEATESSVKNITADLWTSFGARLNNSGENLVLSFTSTSLGTSATTTIDEIPFCFNWCGVPSSRTTERYDPDSPSRTTSDWSANSALIVNGQNSVGNQIFGTPRARNSINYFIARGVQINTDTTLTKAGSPYLVDGIAQRISEGKTLTIEPGVVIKFRGAAWLMADGNIVANGTSADPIVFTAFADDTYGGDLDRVVTTPLKGSWFGVELSNKSTASSFDHTIFRYGGNHGFGVYKKAILYVGQTSPPITNSIFEYSKAYGLYLDGSNSTVSHNSFSGNIGDPSSVGLNVVNGAPSISNNTFTSNNIGLSVVAGSATVLNNNFSSNTTAMTAFGPVGTISGNSGAPGDTINLTGSIAILSATTTLTSNPMPYLMLGTVTVPAGSALDIKEGTVMKNSTAGGGSMLNVFGRLNINTSTTSGVTFMSNSAIPTKTDWYGIILNPGSTSYIKGATIRDARVGIKYTGSAISLEDVNFFNNTIDKSP
ncbi:MAG: lamin tail domain-containing protein, partial [bacterium]|nr:lamin tail domain-containing protein [bacterium]